MGSYLTEDTNVTVKHNFTVEAQLIEELNANFTRYVFPVTVFVGLETIIGFIGNIFVLVIVHLYYKASTFKCFVLCLAVIDIICCSITMPGEMYSQLRWYAYTLEGLCKFKSFFNLFTVIAEAFCLLGIALDRYRKVCCPLKWQIRRRVAKYWCFLLYALALALAFPILFLWGIRPVKKDYSGVTISYTVCEKDAAFDHTNYPLIHLAGVAVLVCTLLLVMLMMYVMIAKRLCSKPILRVNSNEEMMPPKGSESKPPANRSDVSNIANADETRTPNDIKCSFTTRGDIATSSEAEGSSCSSQCEDSKVQTENPSSGKNLVAARVRRKTLIMFILTLTFIITVFTYFVLISNMASSRDVLENLSDSAKAAYFFFLRLYFINHAINPFVYGVLDPKFKAGVKSFSKALAKKVLRQ